MKQKTLLLFQLLLAVFAFYAVVKYSGNLRLLVPLFCLSAMFVVSKIEGHVLQPVPQKGGLNGDSGKEKERQTEFRPLDCLLKSNNVLLLIDAVHYLLKELGLAVALPPDHRAIDRLVTLTGQQVTFGIKILGDVSQVNAAWDSWSDLEEFDMGRGGRRRLLLIGSNCVVNGQEEQQKFKNFPAAAEQLLSSKGIVAMTTLTFYKLFLLCKKKKVSPKTVFNLLRYHPGGVFRLEQYAKNSGKAA